MGRPATGYAPTRERLLRITRDAIAERGVDAVALADVAEAADLTVPTLYHYFRDRHDLILSALRAEVAELLDTVAVPAELAESPEARLRVFFERQAECLTSTRPPTLALVLRSLLVADDDDLRVAASAALGHAEGLFGDVVVRMFPDRPAAEQRTLTDLLRACLAGLYLMRAVDADLDPAAIADLLLEVVLAGAHSSK